jgi:peptidoglycan hydrolase-like protein with peptidoglycan-binding domain
MRRSAALCTLTAAAAFPVPALAQVPAAPAPAPAPMPVETQMTLQLERVGGTRSTVLAGSRVRIRGTVGAFAPDETVTVRVSSTGRKVYVRRVAIGVGADGTSGAFLLSYRATRVGRLVVRAVHDPTPALGALAAVGRSVDVLPRRVGPASRRAAVRALQRRLRRLGYVVGAPGLYDAGTARAVLAFRKVTGMRRTFAASAPVMRAIARGAGWFGIRRPGHGRHIEADLSRQVIALISGGRVERIYPVSSGAPGTPTIRGSFRIYSKTPGTNAKGMVDAAYFSGGYATHGYASVPPFPASHGCLRVPLVDAPSLFRWIRIGTRVDVYP